MWRVRIVSRPMYMICNGVDCSYLTVLETSCLVRGISPFASVRNNYLKYVPVYPQMATPQQHPDLIMF